MNLDRNTLIGLLLMLLLGLGFSWYSAVQQEKQAANTPLAADSTATATPGAAAVPVADSLSIPAAADSLPSDSLARMQEFINRRRFGAVADAMNGEEREVVLRNDKIRVTLSTLGGMFTSATLVDGYTRYASDEPIALWDSTLSAMSLKWMNTGKESILTSQLYFTPSAEEVNASSAAGSLVMRLNTADPARTMELVYTLQPGSYAVACEVRMAGLMNEVNEQAAPVALVW
ncbi:MAG: YidC/Oxa1 family insertase periplasmic-domain containing protein, partial [Bacteroidota bacterium]